MKETYRKRALLLSIATVGYNIIEGVAAVTVGLLTNSSALFSFGLDSFTESRSGSVMIWRFGKQLSEEEEERIEQKAQKLVAFTFFILGAFVLYEAITQPVAREEPEKSLFGIAVAVLSLIIMPALMLAKYRTGKLLKSKSLIADSKQTLACVIMSATLLLGVGLNYFFGLWWADPIAAIAIAIMLLLEGKEALEGEENEE